jgi:hypothetical protein
MSIDCHTLRPLIGSYVLGGLDPDETEAVREHLASCPGCAAEHSRLAPLPGLLTLAAGAEAAVADPPSAALEERLLDAVAREAPKRRRRGRLRRRAWLAVPAVAAVVAVTVALVVVTGGDGGRGYPVTLQASTAEPHARAWAELASVPGGTSMHLWVKGLPSDPKAVYEVHCDAPGWSASAGTFRVGANGSAIVLLNTAARRGQYDSIRIVRQQDRRLMFSASLS